MRREKYGYELTYFQPIFDAKVNWQDTIEVLQYEGEIYLLFCDQYKQNAMTVYWLSEGIPCGRLTLAYQCADIDVEIIKNDKGLVIELNELLKKYGDNQQIYLPCSDTEKPLAGDRDNDGVREEYVKQNSCVHIEEEGMPKRGLYRYFNILFGGGM